MATDIWALGCMIFKLLTGNVPFTGTNSHLVYQKIFKKDIDFPEYLSVEAVALIDSMLMLNPMERLGAPGGKCGIQNLKNHPFFKGVDFNVPKSLCLTDYHRTLITGQQPTSQIDTMTRAGIPRKSAYMAEGLEIPELICKGFLLKKNRWFQKQIRLFYLYSNGEFKYYKDIKKYKGKITLAKGTKVLKTGKNQIEIPTNDKTYIFVELDKKDQSSSEYNIEHNGDEHLFTNDIDKWIEALEIVVDKL